MAEISAITFESLYDTVRKERSTEELQKLNPDFYRQVVDYLKTKTDAYKAAKEKNNTLPMELERIKSQILSAKKLVKDLYERREKKVLQLSMHKSRLDSADESCFFPEEKMIYDEFLVILDKYRRDILLNLVNAKMPVITGLPPPVRIQANQDQGKISESKQAIVQKEPFSERIAIKFLMEVPQFLGPRMEIYGPFIVGDELNLYSELAETLIKMRAAEKI